MDIIEVWCHVTGCHMVAPAFYPKVVSKYQRRYYEEVPHDRSARDDTGMINPSQQKMVSGGGNIREMGEDESHVLLSDIPPDRDKEKKHRKS